MGYGSVAVVDVPYARHPSIVPTKAVRSKTRASGETAGTRLSDDMSCAVNLCFYTFPGKSC